MKSLTPALAEHLQSGATNLCHCWKLTARDDAVHGFTDHDRPVSFGGLTYEAASGFSASAVESGLGLRIDNLEVQGALASPALDEVRLAQGFYNNARIEIWRVNWRDPAQRVLLRAGNIGEIRRTAYGFSCELLGLANKLSQPCGRLYQYFCDADLGDHRCRVDLSDPRFAGQGRIESADQAPCFAAAGLDAFGSGWFTGGRLAFTSGDNARLGFEIRRHLRHDSRTLLEFWEMPVRPPKPGDRFTIRAGCDKSFDACRSKFGNGLNFRGFPHMPGNDFAQSYPRPEGRHDGTSRQNP